MIPTKKDSAATGGLQPFTWTIDSGALPPGLTLTAGGVLSGTPPTGSAGTYNFTVRVTDSQSPVKAYQVANLSLMINPPLSFPATTLSGGVIAVPYSSSVVAMGGITPYTYKVISDPDCLFTTTTGCASNGGLTMNSSGAITGTPTGPIGTHPFTVQVTDSFPTTATGNFSITITGKIQGNYAFSFNGYNQQGQAFYTAGSFVADGNGNITSGVFDRNGNDTTGSMTDVMMTPGTGANGQCPASGPPTGTGSVYCVGRSGVTSGNNLGTIVIASALGTYSFSVAVSLVSDSKIVLADPNHPDLWGSGLLRSQGQSLSGISLASGNFAFGLFGIDAAGNRYGAAGYFITDSNGIIQPGSGLADINDNGGVQRQAALSGSVIYPDPVDSTAGRGTATFTIGTNTFHYAFYVVPAAAGKLFPSLVAVQTDPVSGGVPVTLASISQRGAAAGGAFTVKSLNATRGLSPNGAVFELNAVSTAGGTPAADMSVGLGNFDGNGNITSYIFDENNGGALTTPSQNSYTGTYTVDAISGRVSVSLTGITNQPVWYLVTFNTGFVVGTDPNVTAGVFEPQTVSQPITILSLFGIFYGGTSNPVLPSVINEVEAAVVTPPPPPGSGNGTFNATYDSSGTTLPMMNQMSNECYTTPDPGTGRTLVYQLDSNKTCNNPTILVDILYLVSGGASGATGATTKNVSVSTSTNPSLTVLAH